MKYLFLFVFLIGCVPDHVHVCPPEKSDEMGKFYNDCMVNGGRTQCQDMVELIYCHRVEKNK